MRKILNSYILASFLLVSLATFLWTCGGGGGGGGSSPDNTAPTVSSTSPDNNAVDVSIITAVSVIFSEQMDASTVDNTTFTVTDGGPVTGTVSYSGTTATFTLTDPLELSTTYTATVSTGVTDKAGNALAQNYTWSFTTAATFTGFTPADVMGKAFATIVPFLVSDAQIDVWDDGVIQFVDTENFDFWEDDSSEGLTEGQGTWSINTNGQLILILPGEFNVTVTLQDDTAEYIDVQIDDGSTTEDARLYKTNPFVDADVSGHTFDFGDGLTFTFMVGGRGTSSDPDFGDFGWEVDNGVLVIAYDDGFKDFAYLLVHDEPNTPDDPNITIVEFDDTGQFDGVFPEKFSVVP